MSEIEIAMPAASAAAKPAAKLAEETKRPTPWRDNIEAMLMAIVMALVLKYFIVEAYRIPTGSMQPTLMGNPGTGIFDRILVDKFTPVLRDPYRFETWVFRYPLDQSKNYVKRVVGIGPEEFRVHNGDLWNRPIGFSDPSDIQNNGWKVLRRPRRVQGETWLALIKDDAGDPLFYSADDHKVSWSREVTHKGDFRMRYGASLAGVMDVYNDGYPDAIKDMIDDGLVKGASSHPVGDLRVSGVVTPADDCQWIEVLIKENSMQYRMRIPGPAAPEGARPSIAVSDTQPGTKLAPFGAQNEGEPMRLKAGSSYDFGAQNLDDLLEIELDGEVLCAMEIPSTSNQASSLYLENKGGASFEDLMVYRDIFYTLTQSSVGQWTIPEGHYFMMGDNTLNSADSRAWVKYRFDRDANFGAEASEGDQELEVFEGNFRGASNWGQTDFDPDKNPNETFQSTTDLRSITWFRDIFGEMHAFEKGEVQPSKPETLRAPFVPREKMLGRAVSVFWPLKPLDKVWRFKWIH